MTDYHVTYHWDTSYVTPVLFVTTTGKILSDPQTIPTIIDQTHALIEKQREHAALILVYDTIGTERRLPLESLMGRQVFSPKVKGVILIGARARTDEMAVLIMSAAKRLPYDIQFFDTRDEAEAYLRAQDAPHDT
jgi:hypothetical protein